MCDPASIGVATGGLSLANAGLGFLGQGARAKTNAANAQRDFQLSMMQLALRMQQERIQAATKVHYYNKEKNAAVAEAKVRASEMGVSGNTLDDLVGDLEMQNAERVNITRENSDAAISQLRMASVGEGAQLQSRLAAVPAPSLSGLALGAASAGLDGFNTYNRLLRLNRDA
jgi:hypothetical protein